MGVIVKVDKRNYRKIAQENWGLTDEQMIGMHVHHRTPRSQGGTNDAANLYVCTPWFHRNIWHGENTTLSFIELCTEAGRKGGSAPLTPKRAEALQKLAKNKVGTTRSRSTRDKISETLLGRKLPEKHRQKISKTLKGVSKSQSHKQSLSIASKGKPKTKLTCPHCGKVGGGGVMYVWHFDKCKNK